MKELKVASSRGLSEGWRTPGGAGELLSAAKGCSVKVRCAFCQVEVRRQRLRKLQNSVSGLSGNKRLPIMRL